MNGKVKLQAPAREAPCVALPPRRFPGSPPAANRGERPSAGLHVASACQTTRRQSSQLDRQAVTFTGQSNGRQTHDFIPHFHLSHCSVSKWRNDSIVASNQKWVSEGQSMQRYTDIFWNEAHKKIFHVSNRNRIKTLELELKLTVDKN